MTDLEKMIWASAFVYDLKRRGLEPRYDFSDADEAVSYFQKEGKNRLRNAPATCNLSIYVDDTDTSI